MLLWKRVDRSENRSVVMDRDDKSTVNIYSGSSWGFRHTRRWFTCGVLHGGTEINEV